MTRVNKRIILYCIVCLVDVMHQNMTNVSRSTHARHYIDNICVDRLSRETDWKIYKGRQCISEEGRKHRARLRMREKERGERRREFSNIRCCLDEKSRAVWICRTRKVKKENEMVQFRERTRISVRVQFRRN